MSRRGDCWDNAVVESFFAALMAELVHRMEGELGPDEGARRYAQALREGVAAREGDLPVLDLIVLGIGPDGHVASLFPGFPQLDVDDAIAVGVTGSPKPPPERVTLTYPALARSEEVWFVVSGSDKAGAVGRALAAQPPGSTVAAVGTFSRRHA